MRRFAIFSARGYLFLVLGAVVLVTGLLLRQRDVLRLGVLLLAVPLLSGGLLALTPTALRLRRSVAPEKVSAGSPAMVSVTVLNPSRFATRLSLASEELPYSLGARPRFVVDRLAPGEDVTVTYRVTPEMRGSYRLGPLTYRQSDPFGMAEIERRYPGTASLLARPAVRPLGGDDAAAGVTGVGDIGQRTVAPVGEFDVAAREYRHGDDLRRVHWPSTARRGEIMMRSEEQSQELLATVLLDARAEAHHGDRAGSSLEWAVSAAASICEHLSAAGFSVRLLTDGHDPGWLAGDDMLGRDLRLDRLGLLPAGPREWLTEAVSVLSFQPTAEFVVAVLGSLTDSQAASVARLSPGIALLCDPTGFGAPPGAFTPPADAARLFAGAGWSPVRYQATLPVAQAWRQAMAAHQVERSGLR